MNIKEIGKKAIVPVTSAIVGGLVVIAALKLSPSVGSKVNGNMDRGQRDEHIYDDFIAQNNPFEEMKKMRQQMEERMKGLDSKSHSMSNPFDSWISDKFGGGTINDISKREDDNFIYYDIKVDDVNSTSINTKVERGYVTISGTMEKNSGSEGKDDSYSAQNVFKSSFNRTFPLPENVDQNRMQMLTEKDKVVLKFPKKKA